MLIVLFLIGALRMLVRKSTGPSMWVLLLFLIYWYPAVLIEIPYGFSSQTSAVSAHTKLMVSFMLIMVLAFDFLHEKFFKIISKKHLAIESSRVNSLRFNKSLIILRIDWILILVCMFYLAPLLSLTSTGSKAEVMAKLGYVFKIFELLALLVIARSVRHGPIALVGCLVLVVFDLMFGMRFVAGIGLVAFFVAAASKSNNGNYVNKLMTPAIVKISFLIAIVAALFFKIIYPFLVIFDFSQMIDFVDGDKIRQAFGMNSESNSFVIIFNEVIKNDFDIGFMHLIKQLPSIIPFIESPFDVPSFSSVVKNSGILQLEGESFASNNFALFYSIFGEFGPVLLMFILLLTLTVLSYFLLVEVFWIDLMPLVSVLMALVIVYFARSDLSYFMGLIRGVILIECFVYIVSKLLRVKPQSMFAK